MRKEEGLLRKLTELIKETQADRIVWDLQCQTTEYNEPAGKPVERMDGIDYTVDECFVSYHCMFRGEEFLMITYEKIYTCGTKRKSSNLVFLPPLGIRFFDLDRLASYAVKTDQMLTYNVHMLWLLLLEKYRNNPQNITLEVSQRE